MLYPKDTLKPNGRTEILISIPAYNKIDNFSNSLLGSETNSEEESSLADDSEN